MFFKLFSLLTRFAHVILGVGTPQVFPPPLPKKEEERLFLLASGGDENARSKLITHNLRLVAHIVKKYYPTAKNGDDLISIGSIGLVKAVDTFLVKNGTKFATYAAKCIQNTILSQRLFYRQTLQKKRLLTEVSTLLIAPKDFGEY